MHCDKNFYELQYPKNKQIWLKNSLWWDPDLQFHASALSSSFSLASLRCDPDDGITLVHDSARELSETCLLKPRTTKAMFLNLGYSYDSFSLRRELRLGPDRYCRLRWNKLEIGLSEVGNFLSPKMTTKRKIVRAWNKEPTFNSVKHNKARMTLGTENNITREINGAGYNRSIWFQFVG